MLTRKQHDLLSYIAGFTATEGHGPSFEQMKDAMGLSSKSGVHRLVAALEERKFIRRRFARARSLEVIRLPETALAAIPTTALQAELARRAA